MPVDGNLGIDLTSCFIYYIDHCNITVTQLEKWVLALSRKKKAPDPRLWLVTSRGRESTGVFLEIIECIGRLGRFECCVVGRGTARQTRRSASPGLRSLPLTQPWRVCGWNKDPRILAGEVSTVHIFATKAPPCELPPPPSPWPDIKWVSGSCRYNATPSCSLLVKL